MINFKKKLEEFEFNILEQDFFQDLTKDYPNDPNFQIIIFLLLLRKKNSFLKLPLEKNFIENELEKVLIDKNNVENLFSTLNKLSNSHYSTIIGKENEKKLLILNKNSLYMQQDFILEKEIYFYLENLNNKEENHKTELEKIISSPYYFITGGPGTGKTTFLKKILTHLEQDSHNNVCLLAPTGKSAKKMNEVFPKIKAQTIHLFFKRSNYLLTHQNTEIKNLYIIIDEASMINISFFYHLFKLTEIHQKKIHFIWIGDPQQLPAINDYSPFKDIIEWVKKHNPQSITHFTKNYRQSFNSKLNISEKILYSKLEKKDFQNFNSFHRDNLGYYFIDFNPNSIQKIVEEYYQVFLAPIYENPSIEKVKNLSSSKILNVTNTGEFGNNKINNYLQFLSNKTLNKSSNSFEWLPLLITENNYRFDVFNGDCAFIYKNNFYFLDEEMRKLKINNEIKFQLNFSMTIHKSQGSEYDFVLIIIPELNPAKILHFKELIFTALTRAKKACYLFSNEKIFSQI